MKYRITEVLCKGSSKKYQVEKKIWWHFKWYLVGVPESFLKDAVHKVKRRESIQTRVMKREEWDK